jgi:hypothetical protein
MLNEITLLYAILDDILKKIGHSEDVKTQTIDAEMMTTYIVSAMFFCLESLPSLQLYERSSSHSKYVR